MIETFLPGVELLKTWLAQQGVTTHRFARESGLDPAELWKILNGRRKAVGLSFAVAVEDATRGVVPVRAWLPRRLERTA